MIKKVRRIIKVIRDMVVIVRKMERDMDNMKMLIGQIVERQMGQLAEDCREYKVYSQWGEDGIIQWLINSIPITNKVFIEFGVEDYSEANTRYLLMKDNWSGLVIDGSETNMQKVRNSDLYWRYNLKAVSKFITKENINEIFMQNGIQGDIGLLSIDIDGNDYWVWKAIHVVSPRIVICEYNSLFGSKREITTPYNAEFARSDYHESNLVYGVSIKALESLANEKGYCLVAGNSAGNNLFFVRKDCMGVLQPKAVDEVYVKAQFREGRKEGKLTYDNFEQRMEVVKECLVYDIQKGELIKLQDVFDEWTD